MKLILSVQKAERVNMGGVFLDQALPINGLDQLDPFLLIHHWKDILPGNQKQEDVGVGPHPHRGFSPVTFVFEGAVHHRDSLGNDEVVTAGGTQWMNSGYGLIHSERPDKDLAENGGVFELIQFWVNSPAKEKMKPPFYYPLSEAETPFIKSEDGRVEIRVVCGALGELKGAISKPEGLNAFRLTFKDKGATTFTIEENQNTLLYLLDGDINVNGRQVKAKQIVILEQSGKRIEMTSNESSRAILLSMKPLNEKVSSYGPFVMNTHDEIARAIDDFNAGKMGTLKEEF